MGKPPAENSTSGRANPKGIAYLYLASDKETAMAEVRPYINDYITIGNFKVKNELSIIDLSNPIIDSPFKYGDKLKYFIGHIAFLKMLGYELSKTINPTNADLDYIPLQFLCEFIKNDGFDGVKYKSSMGNGYNLALFTDIKVVCYSTELYLIDNVDKIQFQYKSIAWKLKKLIKDLDGTNIPKTSVKRVCRISPLNLKFID